MKPGNTEYAISVVPGPIAELAAEPRNKAANESSFKVAAACLWVWERTLPVTESESKLSSHYCSQWYMNLQAKGG